MKIRIKFCPKCGNTDIVFEAGGYIGIYRCKKCGFRSAIFPERKIKLKQTKKKK